VGQTSDHRLIHKGKASVKTTPIPQFSNNLMCRTDFRQKKSNGDHFATARPQRIGTHIDPDLTQEKFSRFLFYPFSRDAKIDFIG